MRPVSYTHLDVYKRQVKKHAHIFRLGNNQLDFVDGCILEHLRERNILAQLALQVESVAFGSNQLDACLLYTSIFIKPS